MSVVYNYISSIPFYDSKADVNSKKDYAFGVTYKNIVYYKNRETVKLPPFVVYTDLSSSSIVSLGLTLFNSKSNTAVQTFSNVLMNVDDNGYCTILFNGLDIVISNLQLGEYFLQIYAFDNVHQYIFCSDYFYLTDDIHNYVLLKWKNSTNLHINNRIIPFELGFEPFCYVDSLIGKPNYEYEEEITKRLGYEFVEMQLSKKTYQFVFIAPEYLCDALRIMKVCDNKQIIRYDFQNYDRGYSVMNMGFEVSWEQPGDLAGVTITFDVDNVVSNTSGYLPLGGDFNNDYNSDFNNG